MEKPNLDKVNIVSSALRFSAWIIMFGVLFILRSFFPVIFLTFVFAYLQSSAVDSFATRISNRNVRCFLVAGFLLTVLVAIGTLFVPLVKEQASIVADKYPTYVKTLDSNLVELSKKYSLLEDIINKEAEKNISPSQSLVQWALEFNNKDQKEEYAEWAIYTLRNVGSNLLGLGSAFLLALLFSFLIVLDLEKIKKGVLGLKDTKLDFVYNEIAPGIRKFGEVLGKTLVAQLFVAIANTILTAVAIYMLGIQDKLALLSIIVFFCSFIPVAGVFISSVPICILALSVAGFTNLVIAVFLILVVHMIEVYVLNPRIYSQHLELNPVFVLIILTIAGKLFHVWGLILGLPICTYFFHHAIKYDEEKN